jgi:hypothetical protein
VSPRPATTIDDPKKQALVALVQLLAMKISLNISNCVLLQVMNSEHATTPVIFIRPHL